MFDTNDLHSLQLCIWKESRGDGAGAMHATCHVILNRIGKPGFGATLHDVIYGKNQFTSMSVPSDPEFNLEPLPGDQSFAAAAWIVSNIPDDDETHGALYYANLKTATSGWFFETIVQHPEKHPVLFTYGHHTFFA